MARAQIVNPALPVGAGILWYTNTAPPGWLLCQGQSLLRTDYPALFALIGTTYGAVDGTHFTLPDLRQRFPLGSNPLALGVTGGALGHTHTLSAHTHTLSAHVHASAAHAHDLPIRVTATQIIGVADASGASSLTASWVSGAFGGGGGVSTRSATVSTTPGNTGGPNTPNTGTPSTPNTGTGDPPYQVVNFAIKAF